MSKYLKLFETESQYEVWKNSDDFLLPNVSFIEEIKGISYNPFTEAKSGVIMARYNATEDNKLAIADTSNVKSLKVNGTEVEFGEMYCFNEVGEYDVEIELIDPTLINGVNFGADMPKTMFWSILDNGPMGACLISIVIPNSVTSIGNQAFCECKGLTSVVIPDSVTTIEDLAFVSCSSLTSVVIGSGVTSIGERAFDSCSSLTSVVIGSGVTSIDSEAFDSCSSLTSIVVSEGNKIYDSRENCNCIIETATNTLIKGGYNSFIPNSVTTIGEYAFHHCSGLTSITIPYSVTTIGSNAFYGCSGLTSITIPYSVTTIGNWSFGYCSGLTSITIPNSVTTIGYGAFGHCSGLTSITIPNSVTSIESEAFRECTSLDVVYIESDVASIGERVFYSCSSLTSVVISSGVTSIGSEAFSFCSSLNEITCNAITAPTISRYAFRNVKSGGILKVPAGSNYSSWMSTNDYYLGKYNWTIEYI